MSAEICEILDSKLHAIVEGSITDRANIAFFHEEGAAEILGQPGATHI